MRNILFPVLLVLALAVTACGGGNQQSARENQPPAQENPQSARGNEQPAQSGTITYESETGPIEVPADPQRVISLSGFTGNLMHLGVPVIGTDVWSKSAPQFAEQLKDVEEVSEEGLEKIIELEPDLIIALSTTKNLDKMSQIAPTVSYTWGALNIFDMHIEVGKAVNKEQEAREWVEGFRKRLEEAGAKIREKIGEDATVTVIEVYDKAIYVFGDNWARGTELLYQEMKLGMPEKVKENALASGYYALSPEVLPEFVGDYLIISKYSNADLSFQDTETYKNIPAVKNGRVLEMTGEGSSFSDPYTLEMQLELFEDFFLNSP
ncbi:MAG: ABC transporter substrate-binding protein [Paenibacillaceae bacterium]|jgi:iron complex transport system substrate-binding protein|nr:MAG: ABC transporter substrate-binding protein [Paenibacillaceae bacterium]